MMPQTVKMAHNESEIQTPNPEISKEILKFLKDGEGEIEIGKYKNVTLVLGFTGSGKSTLSQFLTGNDEGLFAVENGKDTGEYTILDKNHKICRGTIDSCTIIPTLYTDKVTESGLYDCPGFGDTRSVKHDISVTYFIKKVLDSVDSVKLLFTVNHHSVMEGVDRQNFILLVKNVVKMVKNIDKFKDSIALVVTKVDNKYVVKKRQFLLVPDETVIANIANFLQNTKASLEAKMQSKTCDTAFIAEAIKFIDVLLVKNGDDYSRISIFRRPEEEGPLSGSALLQKGKDRMQNMLQSLQYMPKNSADFGYTVSAESVNQMHDLLDQVNEKVSKTFSAMGQAIVDHYTVEESKSKDLGELFEMLMAGYEGLREAREDRSYKSPILLSNEIQKLATSEGIAIPAEHFAEAAHYDDFLGFIRQIGGLTKSSVEWLNGLKGSVETLGDKRQWLNLLVNLQNALLDYNVQKEIQGSLEQLHALLDCIETKERSGSGGQCGIEDFLRRVFKNNLEKEYANARKVKPNVHELKMLRRVLDFWVDFSCRDHDEGSMLIMKGQYLKFSDILLKICPRPIKAVRVFALKKVFIDQSYERRGEKVEVVIMAPIWETVGSPQITLDGADGEDRMWKAQDGGVFGSRNGHHGLSGGNGRQGGMFWGMGQHCFDCHRLSITANGGNGGDGQDGGDGANGRNFHTQYQGDQHGMLVTVFYNKKVDDFIYYGEKGGNGGNGGNGGQGGPSGIAKFALFGNGSKPRTSTAQGRPGKPGAGGTPGKGGQSERRIHRVQTVLVVPWWGDEIISMSPAPDGSWGLNGFTPKQTSQATGRFSKPSETLTDYIRLLNADIDKGLSDATTREFHQNLEKADINDIKHHVGRRSVDVAKDSNTLSNGSSINKASSSISATTRIHPDQPINISRPNSQRINKGDFQNLDKIAGGSSSNPSPPAVYNEFGVIHAQSTLFMMDYLYRMKSRGKIERSNARASNAQLNDYDSDHAQRIAYRAYVPRARSDD